MKSIESKCKHTAAVRLGEPTTKPALLHRPVLLPLCLCAALVCAVLPAAAQPTLTVTPSIVCVGDQIEIELNLMGSGCPMLPDTIESYLTNTLYAQVGSIVIPLTYDNEASWKGSYTTTSDDVGNDTVGVLSDDCPSDPVSLTVVELDGLTPSGATVIDANDCGTVKTTSPDDYVTVTADLNPYTATAATLFTWSGGTPTSDNLQTKVHKNASAETPVTYTGCYETLTGNVWVVWATVTIQSSDVNPSQLTFPDTQPWIGNNLGVEYSSNSNHAAGKICAIATITPSGVHNIITSGWDFFQKTHVSRLY